VKTGLAPIADARTRLFILGSLPGERSLAEARYYAHPTNQFWRLIGAVIGVPLAELDYDSRLACLVERGIGLWDVIHAAERIGSGDSAIRGAIRNPLAALRRDFPRLEAIAFNGGLAASHGRRAFGATEGIALYDLPSSSAAHTMRFAAKLESWRRLAAHVGEPLHGAKIGSG
jgi:TDG/mug DNA glycosylase family protein